jgi:hypothetical protein
MTVEDDIDDLYGVAPVDFLARRKELAAAAKKRGDVDAAKVIGAARKPTTAAWVVNALVRAEGNAKGRLSELSDRLRAAHAAMDGAKIRELSAAQRKLIDELVRAAFKAAAVTQPSAALRDDVVGTLQAAIADPDVAARLGRLEKAERWSGFGEFGTVTAVGPVPKAKAKSEPKSEPKSESKSKGDAEQPEADRAAAEERVASAREEAATAQDAASAAAESLSERTAQLATARRRYEKLLESLNAAEQALNEADGQAEAAERAARDAADRLDAATSALHDAERELARLDPPADASG